MRHKRWPLWGALAAAAVAAGCASKPQSQKNADQLRFFTQGEEVVLAPAALDPNRRIDPESTPRWYPAYREARVQPTQNVRAEFSASWRVIFDDAALESPASVQRLVRMLEKSARYYVVTYEARDPQDLERLSDVWSQELRAKIIAAGVAPAKLLVASHRLLPPESPTPSRIIVEAIP